MADAEAMNGRFPFERLLNFQHIPGGNGPLDQDTMNRIREAVRAAQRGDLSHQQVMDALEGQLTEEERDYAIVELKKDVNLHATLLILDVRYMHRHDWEQIVQSLVRHMAEGNDRNAMALRAGVSAAGQVGQLAAYGCEAATGVTRGDVALNAAVCLMLSVIEIYRWSRKEITTTEMMVRVGEHATGCAAAVGGAAAGGAFGGFIGGPAGACFGAVAGSFLADFFARVVYQKGVHQWSQQQIEDFQARALSEAAAALDINLAEDDYTAARNKYKRHILGAHPDRNPDANHDQACAFIAHWQIVRKHYTDHAQEAAGARDESEVAVYVMVMKIRSSIDDAWRVVRSWFGTARNAVPGQQTQYERIEQYTLFM